MKKQMKQIITLILAIILVCTSVPVQANAAKHGKGSGKKQPVQEQIAVEVPADEQLEEEPAEVPSEEVIEVPAEESVEEPIEETEDAEPAADNTAVEEPEPEVQEEAAVVAPEEYEGGDLSFENEEYSITVSYTEEAKIPEGTGLAVDVIDPNTEKYQEFFDKTLAKLNENATYGSELLPDTRKSIAGATFFDISLINGEKKVEPVVPVRVNIHFKKMGLLKSAGEQSKVIHFGSKGTEIIDGDSLITGVSSEKISSGVFVNDFTYMQGGFSVVGPFTTSEYVDSGAVVKGAPRIMAVRAAEEPNPGNKTVTDDDEDGIYDLELSFVGSSNQTTTEKVYKSNVVLVIDTSGSMEESTYVVYTGSNYSSGTYYGDVNNQKTQLIYYNGSLYYNYYGRYYNYSGTVYTQSTRMAETKKAADALVDALLANNKNEDGKRDIVEISLVSFAGCRNNSTYGYLTTHITKGGATTDATTIKNAIDNLTANGGTNWEAALKRAKTEADKYANDSADDPNVIETTSIIFLTDGKPTLYGTNDSGSGQEDNNNVNTCWNNAADDARTIVTSGYTLYNIFAFGDPSSNGAGYLKALTNYAYTGSGTYNSTETTAYTRSYFYDATDTAALQKAFEAIVDKISNNIGYAGAAISDGVAVGSTHTSATIGGTTNPDKFHYTVYDGSTIVYSVQFSGDTATFTIGGNTYTADCVSVNTPIKNEDGVITKTITSKVATVKVGDKEYKMSPATMDEDGMLNWELAGMGVLGNYRYALTMSVWPSQIGYDIAADLNNGIYPDIDAALDAYGVTDPTERSQIKNSIKKQADGSYSVLTNYSQSVRYYEANEETDEQTHVTNTTYGPEQNRDLPKPDPIPLKGSKLDLTKKWEADLQQKELDELLWEGGVVGGTSTEYQVLLHVWKADTEEELNTLIDADDLSKTYQDYTLGWDDATSSYVWTKSMGVAPGMMISLGTAEGLGLPTDKQVTFGEKQYAVIESGHYYYVTEDDGDLHFELNTKVYHPMVVDGKLYDVTFDGTNVESMVPMTEVLATNVLKGGIDIYKKVYREDMTTEIEDCTDEFAFKVTLWKEDELGNKSPVYTTDDQFDGGKPISGSLGFRVYEGEGSSRTEVKRDAIYSGSTEAKVTVGPDVTTVEYTMQANQYCYIVNVPAGTKYTVEELPGDSYSHFKTDLKEKELGEVIKEVILEDGQTELADHTITDEVHGNMAEYVTFYNWSGSFFVYHSSDKTIEKISFADSRVSGTYDEINGYTYTFDIVAETKDPYLYGGYYKAYSKAGMTEAEILNATYTEDSGKKLWHTDAAGTAYDASKANIWVKAKAYTDLVEEGLGGGTGTAMTPVANKVYYLKEVPNGYIRPYIHYTYDDIAEGKPLKKLYVITATDDTNYDYAGYVLVPATDGTAAETTSLLIKVTKPDGTIDATLTAKSIFNGKTYHGYTDTITRGYLYWTDFSSSIGTEFKFQPCWNTLDKVLVKGLTLRTVNNGTSGDLSSTNAIGVTDEAAE